MTAKPVHQQSLDPEAPLHGFSQCHAGILSHLESLATLPALMAAATQARSVAASTVVLFQNNVLEHHSEEEVELFPAVLRSAHPGDERDLVQGLVERLTGEHRTLETLWKRVEPAINAAAKGKLADIDTAVLAELVHSYSGHARFEEDEFLPLADRILGRNGNHMAALGLSLHMRRTSRSVGHI